MGLDEVNDCRCWRLFDRIIFIRYNSGKPSPSIVIMTLQELQDNALELTIEDRWQLINALMKSVRSRVPLVSKHQVLAASLIGIAKTETTPQTDDQVKAMLVERRIEKFP